MYDVSLVAWQMDVLLLGSMKPGVMRCRPLDASATFTMYRWLVFFIDGWMHGARMWG